MPFFLSPSDQALGQFYSITKNKSKIVNILIFTVNITTEVNQMLKYKVAYFPKQYIKVPMSARGFPSTDLPIQEILITHRREVLKVTSKCTLLKAKVG